MALASFLALIAANQATEVARGLLEAPEARATALRIATVFASLDPVALLYFASLFPARSTLHRTPWPQLTLAAGGALAIASAGVARGSAGYDALHELLRAELTFVAYAIAGIRFAGALLRDPDDLRLRLLFMAVAIVTVPLAPLALNRPFGYATGYHEALPSLATMRIGVGLTMFTIVAFATTAGVLLALRLRAHPAARRDVVLGLAGGLLVAYAGQSLVLARLLAGADLTAPDWPPEPALGFLTNVGRAGASVRWLAFGALVLVAVLRHDALSLQPGSQLAIARGILSLAAIVLVLAALVVARAIAGGDAADLRPLEITLLAIVVASSQVTQKLVARTSSLLLGKPGEGAASDVRDVYVAEARRALAEGRDASTDARLDRLRAALGIGRAEATALERVAASDDGNTALARGVLVAGRYRVESLLGRGAHGRAFLAFDELIGRRVVLKEVPDADGGAQAMAEARAAGSIAHPNVLTIHDVLRREGGSLLVAEHAAGGSLGERIAREGPLDEAAWRALALGLLAGLAAVHERGIVHRDLKPANVFLTTDATPKIGDFGVARIREGHTAGFGEPDAFVGSPAFMAPEQRAGAKATPATDVYALALVLEQAGGVPTWARKVLDRALETEPAARWRDADQMRTAFLRAARVTS